jgi:2-polyprenyl-6-methoxyphenol hydroxylase-like FAD-dependent oxidoreductase
VIIAGAGIGGLVLAVALLKQGVDVKVFERDLTAIRGEGKYRGPIQVRSACRKEQKEASDCRVQHHAHFN